MAAGEGFPRDTRGRDIIDELGHDGLDDFDDRPTPPPTSSGSPASSTPRGWSRGRVAAPTAARHVPREVTSAHSDFWSHPPEPTPEPRPTPPVEQPNSERPPQPPAADVNELLDGYLKKRRAKTPRRPSGTATKQAEQPRTVAPPTPPRRNLGDRLRRPSRTTLIASLAVAATIAGSMTIQSGPRTPGVVPKMPDVVPKPPGVEQHEASPHNEDYTDCGRGETADAEAKNGPLDMFGTQSFSKQLVPCGAPIRKNSEQIMSDIYNNQITNKSINNTGTIYMNAGGSYSAGMFAADKSDSLYKVEFDNNDGNCNADFLNTVDELRVPSDAKAAEGTDMEVAIYDEEQNILAEFWRSSIDHDNKVIKACWGGVKHNASKSTGVFERPYGVAAAGTVMSATQLNADDMKAVLDGGEINHVMGLALVGVKPGEVGVANRHDSYMPGGIGETVSEGSMMTWPDGMKKPEGLSMAAEAIWRQIMKYGIIIEDKSGAISARGQNPDSLEDPSLYDKFLENRSWEEVMSELPWDELVLLDENYLTIKDGDTVVKRLGDGDKTLEFSGSND